jgi:hypothetical protein
MAHTSATIDIPAAAHEVWQLIDNIERPQSGRKPGIRLCSVGCENGPARLTMALTSQRRRVRQSDTGARSCLWFPAIEQLRGGDS